MKRRQIGSSWAVLALVLAAPALASGPGIDPVFLGGETASPGLLKSGLLDFSRLEISHSLTFATTSSSAYGAQSGGLWVTRFGYRLANPLRVAVDVGATLDTSGDGAFFSEKNLFLRGFQVDYRPSRNFQLNIAYQHWPGNASSALGSSPFGYGDSRPWGSPLGIGR